MNRSSKQYGTQKVGTKASIRSAVDYKNNLIVDHNLVIRWRCMASGERKIYGVI